MLDSLLGFLDASPTPYHAVDSIAARLLESGYQRLRERDAWALEAGGKYFVSRNDSALIAFHTGDGDFVERGFRLLGAHTDSPCLKLKPEPAYEKNGYGQLGVEVYGGALLRPWFDRDLSLAGRVEYLDANAELGSKLIKFGRPMLCIPSLAIHLDREVNQGRSTNPQLEMAPVVLQLPEQKPAAAVEGDSPRFSLDALLTQQLEAEHGIKASKILAHELLLYDTQPAALVGLQEDFIAAARLDNLLSCFLGMQAMLESDSGLPAVLVCNDHEEVGSASSSGAKGPFLRSVLERLVDSGLNGAKQDSSTSQAERLERVIQNSLMLSVDNAHGVHPNYADKHDGRHQPRLNGGPVIKINANQAYASNSVGIAQFKAACEAAGVPTQQFVMRSDMACGSTIGPITATEIGVTTVDIGAATFAMHSIRELAGAHDPALMLSALRAFLDRRGLPA